MVMIRIMAMVMALIVVCSAAPSDTLRVLLLDDKSLGALARRNETTGDFEGRLRCD
jgi:hypothetical protein